MVTRNVPPVSAVEPRRAELNWCSSTEERTRSAATSPCAQSASRRKAANSSPPKRAATSPARIERVMIAPTSSSVSAPDEVAVAVVDGLEMVEVHHQHTERTPFRFSPRGLALQFGEEGLAGQQPGQLIMREQAMDVRLEFAVNIVQQVEAQQVLADGELIAVFEESFDDGPSIEERAIGRAEVGDAKTTLARLGVALDGDARVDARGAGVVDAHVRFERAAQRHLFTFERDRGGN